MYNSNTKIKPDYVLCSTASLATLLYMGTGFWSLQYPDAANFFYSGISILSLLLLWLLAQANGDHLTQKGFHELWFGYFSIVAIFAVAGEKLNMSAYVSAGYGATLIGVISILHIISQTRKKTP